MGMELPPPRACEDAIGNQGEGQAIHPRAHGVNPAHAALEGLRQIARIPGIGEQDFTAGFRWQLPFQRNGDELDAGQAFGDCPRCASGK